MRSQSHTIEVTFLSPLLEFYHLSTLTEQVLSANISGKVRVAVPTSLVVVVIGVNLYKNTGSGAGLEQF